MIFAREETLLKQRSTALWQISVLPANQKVLKNSVSKPVRIWLARFSQVSFFGHVFFLMLLLPINWIQLGFFFGINCLVFYTGKNTTPHHGFFPPIMRSWKCSLQPLLKATDGWPGALRRAIWWGVIHRSLRSATAGGRLDAEENLGFERLVEGRWRNWYGVQTIQKYIKMLIPSP